MARAWVVDLWTKTEEGTGKKTPTARSGKGSRWRVDWYEERDGTKRLRSKSFPNKGLAEDHKSKLEHDLRAGVYLPEEFGRKKLADVAALWLDSKKRIKASSRHNYARDLRMYVNPQWGSRRIGTIKKQEIEAWITALQLGTAPAAFLRDSKETGPLSPASIERLHVVLSASLSYAHKAGWITSNPASGVELPEARETPHVYLNYVEVDALADAALGAGGPTDRALIHTLAYTGLRINEALALTAADIDYPKRRAHVRETWSIDEAGKRITGTPKMGRTRRVPLPAFLADELRELTADHDPSAFVFQAKQGGAIHDHNWRSRVWPDAVNGAGLDELGLTPHKLRHTAASMAISAGADVKLVQEMLGHKDATETLNTYGHLWPDRLDQVSDALSKARSAALDLGSS